MIISSATNDNNNLESDSIALTKSDDNKVLYPELSHSAEALSITEVLASRGFWTKSGAVALAVAGLWGLQKSGLIEISTIDSDEASAENQAKLKNTPSKSTKGKTNAVAKRSLPQRETPPPPAPRRETPIVIPPTTDKTTEAPKNVETHKTPVAVETPKDLRSALEAGAKLVYLDQAGGLLDETQASSAVAFVSPYTDRASKKELFKVDITTSNADVSKSIMDLCAATLGKAKVSFYFHGVSLEQHHSPKNVNLGFGNSKSISARRNVNSSKVTQVDSKNTDLIANWLEKFNFNKLKYDRNNNSYLIMKSKKGKEAILECHIQREKKSKHTVHINLLSLSPEALEACVAIQAAAERNNQVFATKTFLAGQYFH
ncbi:MAG: hypothetical protein GWP59_02450 [Chlamydiales bacterium]|nr:hypothetical protein [Chlamydiales bacterium]